MKRWIKILLILVALILIVFVVTYNNSKDNEGDAKDNQDNEITGNIVKEDSESEGISGNIVGGGFEEEINPDISEEDLKNLPADLYTRPCGHYFLEYEVCAGVCPNGQCLVDGKSCYCKGI
jgi:hypothetical protein